jgi:Co/Zn/Cd efflux system component
MDCSSEEQMVRMKLDGMDGIISLQFDLQNRVLAVTHTSRHEEILKRLETLRLGTHFVSSEETAAGDDRHSDDAQSILLWQVLGINFFFFVAEMTAGVIAGSMGLVADSLDMLADSIVYGLALYAVGRSALLKKKVAAAAGYFQLILALMGFAEVIRRFFGTGELPSFETMIIVSFLALLGNAISLYLLQKSKSTEAHMRASMIFTSNDVIVNIGVIIAGVLVLLTGSAYPDLIVGVIIFGLVIRGAFRILQLSK